MKETVIEIISRILDIPEDSIKTTDKLSSIADSLDIVDIIFAIEKEFNICIPDYEIEDIQVVDDIVKIAERWR